MSDGVDRRRKTPPRLRPPATVPAPRQVYAHVWGNFDVSCPACGRMHTVGAYGHARQRRKDQRVNVHARGYDAATGTLRCKGCDAVYYVGLVLWPAGARVTRPEDHVPGAREVQQLARGWAAGAGTEAPRGASGRRVVNGLGEIEDAPEEE